MILFGIAFCSLKDDLVAATNAAVPPYPSLIPLCEPIKETLLIAAKKGGGEYTLYFNIDQRWRTAPVKLNYAIREWNKHNSNTKFAQRRFNTAVKELQKHWNKLYPGILMQRVKDTKYKFVWIEPDYTYYGSIPLTLLDANIKGL